MSIVINPFGNGFSLAEMTQAINILPNQYGRLNQMGLFVNEPIAQRTVLIESVEGELRLLPSTTLVLLPRWALPTCASCAPTPCRISRTMTWSCPRKCKADAVLVFRTRILWSPS